MPTTLLIQGSEKRNTNPENEVGIQTQFNLVSMIFRQFPFPLKSTLRK